MQKPVLCHMRTTKAQIRCLDSTSPLVVIFEISRLQLASVAEQAGLNLTWLKIPEDMFSRDVDYT